MVTSTENDDGGLGRLVEDSIAGMEHHKRYVSAAARYTQNRTEAEDVVQEAYARALRYRRHFRGDSKVSTWLMRIVINAAIDYQRHRRSEEHYRVDPDDELGIVDVDQLASPLPSAEMAYSVREMLERAYADATGKSPSYAIAIDAIARQCLFGETFRKIAEQRGMPKNTLGVHVFSARRFLGAMRTDYESNEVETPLKKAA